MLTGELMERTRLVSVIMTIVLGAALPLRAFGLQDSTAGDVPSENVISPQHQPSTAPAPQGSAEYTTLPLQPGGIAKNFWQMTEQGGWLMWPIYGTFILGLIIVIYQTLRIYFDKKRTPPLLLKNLEDADIEDIWRLAEKHTDTHLGALLNKLCIIHKRNKNILALQEELEGYLNTTKERFGVVRSFATLLSDTAGALGLLGTVWGMYVTFIPGKLESQQIITGMGIALVTTLGGLVVSIILNFAIAWVHSYFHSRLEWVEEHAFIFRDRFGEAQPWTMPKHAGLLSGATPTVLEPDRPSNGNETKTSRPQEPTYLRVISGEEQVGEVGTELSRPYEVRVLDQDGEPIKKQMVSFEANGSQISFGGSQTRVTIETDSRGRARTGAVLGPQVGRHRVTVRVDGDSNLFKEFEVESKPGLPDKLIVISGNTQVANPGEQLPTAFALKLEDSFGNAVPGQSVSFKVTKNKGRFANDKDEIEMTTDAEGVVSTSFWLANQPGSNAVRAFVKSRTKRKLETYFESMGINRNAT
jgi:biopolymer transport protein ExbB/TolQ